MTVEAISQSMKRVVADTLIDRTIALERQLVVAGWYRPDELYEAAVTYGLGAKRLADPLSAYLFAYVCTCHEHGVKPDWDHASFIADTYCDTDVSVWEILAVLNVTEYEANQLDTYAYGVSMLADRRERASKAYHEYAQLVTGDEPEYVTQPTRTAIPKHLRRNGGRRARRSTV